MAPSAVGRCALLLASLIPVLIACDGEADGPGGAGGAATSTTIATTSTATTAAATTSTSTASGNGSTSSGSAGTGGGQCPAVPVTRGTTPVCADVGPLEVIVQGTTECGEDSSVYWPVRVFRVPVQAGDCVHMRADNAGSPMGADLFGAVLHPAGKSLLFDEERPCTVANPEGYKCPDGGTTTDSTGDAWVMVGAWEGAGCVPKALEPFQLSVSVNGADVTPEPVCAGDLQVIIP